MIEQPKPMLCQSTEPFDSPDHAFEIKWDGVRALARADGDRWRMWGRRDETDLAERYPELSLLGELPDGTVVDGEVVLFENQLPSLSALLARHSLRNARRIQFAARRQPVSYVLFDVLFHRGESLVDRPYQQRRDVLVSLLDMLKRRSGTAPFAISKCTLHQGRRLFQSVLALGHEGLVAKHLSGRYHVGRRHRDWRELAAVVIGYRGWKRVRSLLVAALNEQGTLQYVAELSSGLRDAISFSLFGRLSRLRRERPVVPCPKRGVWVDPVVCCLVKYLERTPRGRLREARFAGLLED